MTHPPRPFWATLVMLLALANCADAAAPPKPYTASVDHWYDGDTVWVKHCYGNHCELEKVRFRAFDAPEKNQPGGPEALAYVNKHFGKGVKLTISPVGPKDRFGRVIANISAGDKDVACEMAALGLGMVDARYKPSEELKAAQKSAAEKGLGIWADPNVVAPSEWRARGKSKRIQLRKAG